MTPSRPPALPDVASSNVVVEAETASTVATVPFSDRPGPAGVLDTVIQRLFALGLTVQSVAMSLDEDERAATLGDVVAAIDITIGEVRRHMADVDAARPGPRPSLGGAAW